MSLAYPHIAAAAPVEEWSLLGHLEEFFHRRPLAPADRLLVAVSGGIDSTALLWGMKRLESRLGLAVHAAHLDHALDAGSAARAAAVERLCESLRVPLTRERLERAGERRTGESSEAAARRRRYRFLELERRRLGARWVLTAHQADDQAETVLLRLLYGSGIAGLAGIAERRGRIVRPLLEVSRRQLRAELAASGLLPIDDPTNDDLTVPRNLVRHRLIPSLAPGWPTLVDDLTALGRAARGARRRLERLAAAETGMRRDGSLVSVDRAALCRLPDPLWPFALARATRLAGLTYPPGRDARRELRRQLAGGDDVGCDQGGGWRWSARGDRLQLEPAPRPAEPQPFCHSFTAPGEVEVPEAGVRLRLRPARREAWMLRGAPDRTGLGMDLTPGARVTVRSRRPGDRLRPLGCNHHRRLKKVLIDHRVPRHRRDRLPLLEVGGRIVWVPGVTVDHDCRLAPGLQVWLAEIETT